MLILSKVIPVTAIFAGVTVISHFLLNSEPSFVVTVIVAVPAFFAVTRPFAFTVAIVSSEELQLHSFMVASSGVIVAVSWRVCPSSSSPSVLSSVISSAAIKSFISVLVTVTLHVLVFPFEVVAVIMAVPSETAVTLPSFTVTTCSSELVHVISLLPVASSG